MSSAAAPMGPGSSPTRVGPYRLEAVIGRGAMGVVYRAAHVETGRRVAVKTIAQASGAHLRGLRSEIHALGRIHRPGVVRILDEGIEGGIPWFAMELLEGRTLRSYLEDLWRSSERRQVAAAGRLAECLTIFGGLCDPLAWIHGRGIVHGDLKPENVHLSAEGRPVLADFGRVSHFGTASGREVLEIGGEIRGTAWYMAPEQIRGEMIDARADLYALGCMLYEALTGRPPFTGATAAETFRQHLRDQPVPPSERVAEIPPAVEELVLQLLRKSRRARLGYAELVPARISDSGYAVEPAAAEKSGPYLYRAELAGRRDALERLGALVDRGLERRGGLAFVAGESGVGKTRLVMEAATAAAERGMLVVPAECSPGGGPLHAFRPALVALADRCRELGEAATARILGSRGAVLGAYEPALAELPGQAALPPPAPLSADAERERLQRSLLESLTVLAGEDRPILLVLDDVQWADELSLHVLAGIERRGLERAPILVLATYRSEEVGRSLRAIVEREGATVLGLRGLDSPSVDDIVGDMLALQDPAGPLSGALFSRTEGNPFFVVEYLRVAVGERLLVRDRRGAWRLDAPDGGLPLPGSLGELVARRLALLTLGARELAERASVLGNLFPEELLMAVAAGDEAAAMEAAQELVQHHVLERDRGGSLRFTHAKIREATAAGIGVDRLPDLHRRAALAIEAHHPEETSLAPHYGRLADHWEAAGEAARMIEYLEKAGRHGLRMSAYEDAARFFEKALSAPLDGAAEALRASRRAAWENRLGEALWALGDLGGAGAHTLEALRLIGRPAPRSKRRWALAFAREAAEHLALRALPWRPRLGAAARERCDEIARAASRLNYLYYFTQEALPMTAMTLTAVNSAERAGGDLPVARSYAQLGSIAGMARLDRFALRSFGRAREVARRTADVGALGIALYHESLHQICYCRWPEAEQRGLESLERLREIGDEQEAEIAETLLGHVEYYTGRLRDSAERYARMTERARARGNVQHEAWGLYAEARALLPVGEFEKAFELLRRARMLLENHPDHASAFITEGLFALALLERGRADEAAAAATEAVASAGKGLPPVFSTYHGFAAAAEVCARLATRADAGAERQRLMMPLDQARTGLRGLARIFPVARPAAALAGALADYLAGSHQRAARSCQRSLASAQALSIPYEQALARLWVLRLGLGGADERRAHAAAAREVFTRLGCRAHLQEVEALG